MSNDMFTLCLETCFPNVYRHVYVYPLFNDMFTHCLKTCLPDVGRYVYSMFEDIKGGQKKPNKNAPQFLHNFSGYKHARY